MTHSAATAEVEERVIGYRRLDSGLPLRAAMRDRGLTITDLAAATDEADPLGAGVNWRMIGFLISQGTSGRETCTPRTGELIAHALDVPVDQVFEARITQVVRLHGVSTLSRIEVHTA